MSLNDGRTQQFIIHPQTRITGVAQALTSQHNHRNDGDIINNFQARINQYRPLMLHLMKCSANYILQAEYTLDNDNKES